MSIVLKKDNMQGAAAGVHTTVTASDTVVTGLREVWYAYATLGSDAIAAAATGECRHSRSSGGRRDHPGENVDLCAGSSDHVCRTVYWYAVGR